jgi:iron complex transport system ATP-binding protein
LIARALATEARILLLDEPTAGLDVAHVLRTHALMRELARAGHAVVCVLHDLGDVEQHADRVALLSKGNLVSLGAAADALDEPHLREVYGVRRTGEARTSFHLLEHAP